jgi:hypothetical protein
VQYPSYSFVYSADATQYFFESIGPKGVIQKAVVFTLLYEPNVYNLALGDVNPVTGEIDDQTVSDNSDMPVVLSTIFTITKQYLRNNPHHFVHFRGNTSARNRLYRMAMNHANEELTNSFAVFGYCHGTWEEFASNRPYEVFLIREK